MMLQKTNLSRWLRTLLSTTNAKKHNRGTQARAGRKMLVESLERREVFDAGWAVGMQGALVSDMVGDADGNTYVTGVLSSQATIGNSTFSSSSGHMFVAKSDSNGQFLWAFQFGGSVTTDNNSRGIALDAAGNVFVAGSFSGSAQFGSQVLTSVGASDAFVAKLSGGNGQFVWAQSSGGSLNDFVLDVAVDPAGNVLISGGFDNSNPSGPYAPVLFVGKVNNSTGDEMWTKRILVSGPYSYLQSITVDASGAIFANGTLDGTAEFPFGTVARSGSDRNALVSKLDSDGNWLWAKALPGDTSAYVAGSTVGPDGQLYVVGSFRGTIQNGSAFLTSASADAGDAFVAQVDTLTGTAQWTRRMGGSSFDIATALRFDSLGRMLVAGNFIGAADFGSTMLSSSPEIGTSPIGAQFLTSLDSAGTFLESHRVLAHSKNAAASIKGLNIDANGLIYMGVFTLGGIEQFSQKQISFDIASGAISKLPPAASTKFYVVDDSAKDRTYQYASSGELTIDNFLMNTGNTAPRGAASNATGSTVWVGDKNRNVYVYSSSGALQGSWTASSLSSTAVVEGVASNGTDVWIVDNKTDKVFKHTGAASRISGSQSAASSFSLNSANTNPKGIVTDGTSIWVLNDSTTDKIFKYTVSGSFLGSWTIDSANTSPTGLTIDPTNGSQDIWVVDNGTDKIYQYANSRSRTSSSGQVASSATYALAVGNTNPQGIADPPPVSLMLANSNAKVASNDNGIAVAFPLGVGPVPMPSFDAASSSVSANTLPRVQTVVRSTDDFMSTLARSSQMPQAAAMIAWTSPVVSRELMDSSESDKLQTADDEINALIGLVANNLWN